MYNKRFNFMFLSFAYLMLSCFFVTSCGGDKSADEAPRDKLLAAFNDYASAVREGDLEQYKSVTCGPINEFAQTMDESDFLKFSDTVKAVYSDQIAGGDINFTPVGNRYEASFPNGQNDIGKLILWMTGGEFKVCDSVG